MQTIPLISLSIAFFPALVVIGILFTWSLNASNAVYAISRMLAQLLIIGYFLAYIFESDHALVIMVILAFMACVASWIALGTVKEKRHSLYKYALLSIAFGGGLTLLCVTKGVLALKTWYSPQFVIPLAGMIFANAMNSISLAVERFTAEMDRNVSYEQARNTAFQAALIPIINSLFAVGLVSLPGMMTGQILSGVSPFIAIRYQIMVMCMIFGSAGISTACFLLLIRQVFENKQPG